MKGRGHDEIEMRFEPEEYVRIVVPNEVDPMGVVVLNEISGRITATGHVRRAGTSNWRRQVSSSCSTEPSCPYAAWLVRSSLAVLAARCRNVPTGHTDEIARPPSATVRVRIQVDDEVFDVARKRVRVPRVSPRRRRRIRLDRYDAAAVVRDVLTGRRMMAEVTPSRRPLRARGVLRDLVATLAALEAFVHGAIRCHAMSALFDEFQTERVA